MSIRVLSRRNSIGVLNQYYSTAEAGLGIGMPEEGLILDLDVRVLTGYSDSDPVPLWPDSSPEGNDATSSGGPQYSSTGFSGKPSLEFTDFMEVPTLWTGAQDRSLFVVYQCTGAGVHAAAGQSGFSVPGQWFVIQCRSTGDPYFAGYGADLEGPAVDGLGKVAAAICEDSVVSLYKNNTLVNSGEKTLDTAATFLIGDSSGSEPWSGYISAVVAYDRAVTAEERDSIINYLAAAHL